MSNSRPQIQSVPIVETDGRIEVSSPFPTGNQVIQSALDWVGEKTTHLQAAAQSSLDFWDNPLDDEDWNRA